MLMLIARVNGRRYRKRSPLSPAMCLIVGRLGTVRLLLTLQHQIQNKAEEQAGGDYKSESCFAVVSQSTEAATTACTTTMALWTCRTSRVILRRWAMTRYAFHPMIGRVRVSGVPKWAAWDIAA